MAYNRAAERQKRLLAKEPSYVRTVRDDGRKYVDPNEFIKDPKVQRQIRRLAREAHGDDGAG